jgi:peptide subunit release factor 1 (eRF1)
VVLRQGIAREREALTRATRDERAAFEDCVTAVEARLPAGDEMPGVPGLACLCSAGGDMISEALPARVDSSVTWRDGPRILPYLSALAGTPPALVVMIDRQGASISRLVNGTLRAAESFESGATREAGPHMGDSPRPGFHGGTRGETQTDATQRQLREVRDRLVSETAHRLAVMANSGSFVVLGGASEATAHLFSSLAPALATRTVIAEDLHLQTPATAIPGLAREALAPVVAAWQERHFEELQRRAHANGHAAFGFEALAAAAELGAIEELILSDTLCREREAALEPMVQQAIVDGASIALAAPSAAAMLDAECGGAVAKLRFALAGVGVEGVAPRALVPHAPS